MKYISKDIETYESAKEYVDTAVVPLYALSFNSEMKQAASSAEFITLLSSFLEKQFTGRLLLLPPFTYLKAATNEEAFNALKKWENAMVESEINHIFYLTSDSEWKSHEQELSGNLIWLPSLPLEHLSDSQKISMVESQVKQLLGLFTRKWHENL